MDLSQSIGELSTYTRISDLIYLDQGLALMDHILASMDLASTSRSGSIAKYPGMGIGVPVPKYRISIPSVNI